VRANVSAGFSIVSYTANSDSTATIGHGLGKELDFIIVKNRDYVQNWYVYHSSLGPTYRTTLNSTAASFSVTGVWNGTAPSSTVFSTVQDPITFQDGDRHIAYCWAEIEGFSKFGSYVGNGSADGPFVYTGFRPAFVLIKCSSSDQSGNAWWLMYDNKRLGYNPDNAHFGAQSSNAEFNASPIDLTSNGFKLRDTNTSRNASGATYIYYAVAENPFQSSRAR
jgi:hypothetical protein